jgi:hypothetical protein
MFYEVLQNIMRIVISVSIVGVLFYIDYSILFQKKVVLLRIDIESYAFVSLFVLGITIEFFKGGVILSEVPLYLIALTLLYTLIFSWLFYLVRKSYDCFGGTTENLNKAIISSLYEMKMEYDQYDFNNDISLPDINNSIRVNRIFDSRLRISLEKGKDILFFKELIKRVKKYHEKKEIKPIGGFYLWYFPIITILSVFYWLRFLF